MNAITQTRRRPEPLRVPVLVDDNYYEQPTPEQPWKRLERAMELTSAKTGLAMCWHAVYDGATHTWHGEAMAGQNHVVFAKASHQDLFVVQRLLAWELEETMGVRRGS